MLILCVGLGLTPAWAQKIRLKCGAFDPLAGPLPVRGLPSERLAKAAPSSPILKPGEMRLAIVQWADGLSNEKFKGFKALGGQLVLPLPTSAYMVMVPAALDLKTLPFNKQTAGAAAPRWAGEVAPEWKLDPRVQAGVTAALKANLATTTISQYVVQFAYTTGNEKATRAMVQSFGRPAALHSKWKNFENWIMPLTPADVEKLARLNSVFWIEPAPKNKLLSERSGLSLANITNSTGSDLAANSQGTYRVWLDRVGLHGDGVTVQIMDDGLSQGIDSNLPGTAHPDIIGRIAGIDNPTIDPLGNSVGGHGHLNASIIMGQPLAGGGLKDPGGYLLGQGVAPHAEIFATKVFDNSGLFYTDELTNPRMMDSLVEVAYNAGARISSNSWGAPVSGFYTVDSQLFDRLTRDSSSNTGYQPMIFTFSAGNDGQSPGIMGGGTMNAPATAKNVISVGAGENSDRGELDGTMMGPLESDDLRDIAAFSSRGPLSDGRIGPTLVAPGTHISGAASDSINPPFNGSGVSGRLQVKPYEDPSAAKYYPEQRPGQQGYYTWSSGTSHACPAVAGALALLYEYCQKEFHHPPSPALAKAMLVSNAVDVAGGNRNYGVQNDLEKLAPIPNSDAGWGRCSLAGLVDHTRTQFKVDQTDILYSTGQYYEYKVPVADATKPLKIVLAWTDPPAPASALTDLVNDLDLEVTNGVNTWLGNVFAGGESTTGGSADHLNNLECVFIKKPLPGVYTIRVRAGSLNGDALPDTGYDIEQDYALFVSNGAAQSSTAQISFNKTIYQNAEPVTVSLSDLDLKGKGTAAVTLTSLNLGDTENLKLTEFPANSGFFRGTMATIATGKVTTNNNVLTVCNNESIRATYIDNGGVQRKVQATFDIKAPTLLSQELTGVSYDWARFKLVTNEPTSVSLYYMLAPSNTFYSIVSSQEIGTEHELLLSPLMENTPYFYKIKLVDRAGNVSIYDNPSPYTGVAQEYAFQTKARHFDYQDPFDNATSGWTSSGTSTGLKDWFWGTPYPDQITNHAWYTYDINQSRAVTLVSPPFTLKPNTEMSFWQWYKFQTIGQPYAYDGGVIEISTDDGTSWKDLGTHIKKIPTFTPQFLIAMGGGQPTSITLSDWIGNYDARLSTASYNPLGGRMAWSGRSWDRIADAINQYVLYTYQGLYPPPLPKNAMTDTSASASMYRFMYPVNVDLSEFSGERVRIRFRNSSDNSIKGDRWIIDDFALVSPADGVTSLTHIAFDSPAFNSGQARIRFTFADTGLSSGTGAWPVNFRLSTSGNPGVTMPVTPYNLKMIDVRGIWEGYLDVTPTSQGIVMLNNQIMVTEGETVTLFYDDPNVGDGTPYTVSTATRLDSTAPKLVANDVSQVRNHDFLISLATDEPATVTVQLYATSPVSKLVQIYKYSKLSTAMDIQIDKVAADTSYYYTVWLQDEAGNTAYFDNDGFGYGVRTKSYVWMKDTLEPGPSFKWSKDVGVGEDVWQVVENRVFHSASHSWFGHSSPTRNDSSLVMPPIEIKEGYKLRFWHSLNLDTALDGAVIEISEDNGATWLDLGPYIISGIPYNYMISWAFGSPIAGRPAWSGVVNTAMGEVIVDLSPFAGSNRLIRFRLACDQNSRSTTGWYLDDIAIDEYGPSTGNFPGTPLLSAPANALAGASYAQSMGLSWKAATGATKYQVFIGTNPKAMTHLQDTVYTNAQIPEPSLKPGTTYYWCVVAVNGTGVVPSVLRSFKTQIINPVNFANQLIQKSPGLTTLEKSKGDYNGDNKLDITDLIENIRRR